MNTNQALDTVWWLQKTSQPTQLLDAASVLADEVANLRTWLVIKESERQFLKAEIRRLRKEISSSERTKV